MTAFSLEQQIKIVEELVEDFRWARGKNEPEEATYRCMKQIAADLRARRPAEVPVAMRELKRRIDAAKNKKTKLGYTVASLVGVGEELIGRWPALLAAMEELARIRGLLRQSPQPQAEAKPQDGQSRL